MSLLKFRRPVNRILVFELFFNIKLYCEYSKELSLRDNTFEYPQHSFFSQIFFLNFSSNLEPEHFVIYWFQTKLEAIIKSVRFQTGSQRTKKYMISNSDSVTD